MSVHKAYNTPCKGCSCRAAGCHCSCVRYKIFRAAQDRINQQEFNAKTIDDAVFGITKHCRGVDGVTSRRL